MIANIIYFSNYFAITFFYFGGTFMGIEDLDLKKFKEYTRKERTCNEVCSKFGISILEFSYLVKNLNQYLGLVSNQVSLNQIEPQSRYVNGKKVQEHHAIIMTKTVPTIEKLNSLSKLEKQVYDMVLRTTLAMFADPY